MAWAVPVPRPGGHPFVAVIQWDGGGRRGLAKSFNAEIPRSLHGRLLPLVIQGGGCVIEGSATDGGATALTMCSMQLRLRLRPLPTPYPPPSVNATMVQHTRP